MKQILTLVTFFLFSCISAQNLTLAELLEIRKKDLGNAEEYLTAKDWNFMQAEEPEQGKLGSVNFAYNRDDMSNGAEAFLHFVYNNSSTTKKRISMQVNNKDNYNEYINAIKSYGCKLILSKVEDGRIIKVYQGKTTTFRIVTDVNAWYLFILMNEDYNYNFDEE